MRAGEALATPGDPPGLAVRVGATVGADGVVAEVAAVWAEERAAPICSIVLGSFIMMLRSTSSGMSVPDSAPDSVSDWGVSRGTTPVLGEPELCDWRDRERDLVTLWRISVILIRMERR